LDVLERRVVRKLLKEFLYFLLRRLHRHLPVVSGVGPAKL
jgi:hypothetical protein